jgi:hypothetical protein
VRRLFIRDQTIAAGWQHAAMLTQHTAVSLSLFVPPVPVALLPAARGCIQLQAHWHTNTLTLASGSVKTQCFTQSPRVVFTQWPAARIRLAARVEWWFLIHIKAPCRVPQCHCDPIEAAATHTSSVQVTSVDTQVQMISSCNCQNCPSSFLQKIGSTAVETHTRDTRPAVLGILCTQYFMCIEHSYSNT